MKTITIPALLCAVFALTLQAQQVTMTGNVSDSGGAPIHNALVTLASSAEWARTNEQGNYSLSFALPVIRGVTVPALGSVSLTRGMLQIGLTERSHVTATAYHLDGRSEGTIFSAPLGAGNHTIVLSRDRGAEAVRLVRVSVNGRSFTVHSVPFLSTAAAPHRSSVSTPLAKSSNVFDSLRASAPGFRSQTLAVTNYAGVYNFRLVPIDPGSGSSSIDDGSLDRIAAWGSEQYYYGDLGDGEVPLVKIINALSDDALDIVVIFNPDFVDLTYGTGAVGWSGGHTFMQLVLSDHVEIALVNGDGETAMHCKLDLLSPITSAPSGYGTNGPFGGRQSAGEMIIGDPDAVISYGTSFDDNLNYYGYSDMIENSPTTDSLFTPNPDYPNWEYYVVYRLSVDPAIFGESGYGGVYMTSVHASPSKKGSHTVEVTEGDPPPLEDDPFRYTTPKYQTQDYPDRETPIDTVVVPDPVDTTDLPD